MKVRRFWGVLVALVLVAACTPSIPEPKVPGATPAAPLSAQRVAAGIADCPAPNGDPVAGGLADVTLTCLGGDAQVPMAALRGPMLVNVWAQWCAPCRQEAPYLRDFSERAAGRVAVVGLDTADPDPALAIEFARQAGWRYPQITDPDRQVIRALGLSALPMTLFVDSSGRVVHVHAGAFTSTGEILSLVSSHLGVTP